VQGIQTSDVIFGTQLMRQTAARCDVHYAEPDEVERQ